MTEPTLHSLALDPASGAPRRPALAESLAARGIARALAEQSPALADVANRIRLRDLIRGERRRLPPPDLGDPRRAGWTFAMHARDPARADIIRLLRPLAEHRGMPDPDQPLLLDDRDVWTWLDEVYLGGPLSPPPQYILLVGGPERISFGVQAILGTLASVGRLDFDEPQELERYVAKVLRLERGDSPATRAQSIWFAPGGDPGQATELAERLMVRPLSSRTRTQHRVETRLITGVEATKENLLGALASARPALVYTAGHGLAPPPAPLDSQRRLAGGICCRPIPDQPVQRWTVLAEDLPADEPFLEGAVFFQFACFGLGVPELSEFAPWLTGVPERLTDRPFVSALPRRLLANPRGPVGFIGHVDEAWVHGFVDPLDAKLGAAWSARLAPFQNALDRLLTLQPTGLSLGAMARNFAIGNAALVTHLEQSRAGLDLTAERQRYLVNTFIRRTDAKNYLVLGDPGAGLRLPG
jgi:hypothetical protein